MSLFLCYAVSRQLADGSSNSSTQLWQDDGGTSPLALRLSATVAALETVAAGVFVQRWVLHFYRFIGPFCYVFSLCSYCTFVFIAFGPYSSAFTQILATICRFSLCSSFRFLHNVLATKNLNPIYLQKPYSRLYFQIGAAKCPSNSCLSFSALPWRLAEGAKKGTL
jgi:hypothetical protein